MKNFKVFFLIACLLYWTACEDSGGSGGYYPIDQENGSGTETETVSNNDPTDSENEQTETVPDETENNDGTENENEEEIEEPIVDEPIIVEPEIGEDNNEDEEEIIIIDFSGDGTADNPYLINTPEDLIELSYLVNNDATFANAHFRLTANIDLQGIEFTPIGTTNSNNRFYGTFDGGGHTISGLHITADLEDQGLFGYIAKTGKVHNVGVSGTIKGGTNSGGIAGSNTGTVENCYSTVNVSGSNYAGGIVGRNRTDGKIYYCYSTGNICGKIAADCYAGGITGYNSYYVRYCVSLGMSVAGNTAGRISGHNAQTQSYNRARHTMLVNSNTVTTGTSNNKDGQNITFDGTETYTSIFHNWSPEIWNIPEGTLTEVGQLPSLK